MVDNGKYDKEATVFLHGKHQWMQWWVRIGINSSVGIVCHQKAGVKIKNQKENQLCVNDVLSLTYENWSGEDEVKLEELRKKEMI